MKKFHKKNLTFILILFISIGFAVLTTNLGIVSNLSFRNNTFDVHFERAEISTSSTSINNIVNINDTTTISFSNTLTKPTDYIEFTFYVVNSGTIDAQLNSITTSLTTEQKKYIGYNFYYDKDDMEVNLNDYLYRGQARKIKAHFEYNYDIESFYSGETLSTTLTLKYIQPERVTATVWNYEYSGDSQYFIAPKTGTYKIELWGAQGGNNKNLISGRGAYTSGKINLNKNNTLYLYIGNTTNSDKATFNGGGSSFSSFNNNGTNGGGSTDVRLVSGSWNNFNSLKSRIMIAAGGGGLGMNGFSGGAAGGLNGYDGIGEYEDYIGRGGTQTLSGVTSGASSSTFQGKFGIGGLADYSGYTNNGASKSCLGGGGGSGYFAGSAGDWSYELLRLAGGGGGSSYISGHIGCVAIEESSAEDNITFPSKNGKICTDGTIDIECSKHYSGKIFTDTVMIDGQGKEWKYHAGDTEVVASTTVVGMPTHSGNGTMTGNTGNGYARITFVG